MHTLLAAVLLATPFATPSQDPMMPAPPKELKAISWMLGDYTSDLTMYEPGKAEGSPSPGTVSSKMSMGDMYIESRFTADMGGMAMTGLQLTSYDAAKSEYVAYWFDSMAPGVLELRGKLKGQVLTLVSKPGPIPGMPGKHAFRATYGLKGGGKYLFRLEMNSGDGFHKMMEGLNTKPFPQ
jgi:hypothetical protein